MEKNDLVKQLRDLFLADNNEDRILIKVLSDDDIINRVNSCSCCGEKFLTDVELKNCIESAKDVHNFLELRDRYIDLKAPQIQN